MQITDGDLRMSHTWHAAVANNTWDLYNNIAKSYHSCYLATRHCRSAPGPCGASPIAGRTRAASKRAPAAPAAKQVPRAAVPQATSASSAAPKQLAAAEAAEPIEPPLRTRLVRVYAVRAREKLAACAPKRVARAVAAVAVPISVAPSPVAPQSPAFRETNTAP